MQIMPPTGPQITVTRYAINVDGTEVVAYSELLELTSEIDPTPPAPPTDGVVQHTKQFGTVRPPTIKLRRAFDHNSAVWAWHQAALAGDPAAQRTCTLQFIDDTGQIQFAFVLENAWPDTVQITGGGQPPQPAAIMQTDSFICDQIVIQPA